MSAAQILRQAEALKPAAGDVSKGSQEAWVSRQSLQDIYQKLLILDLEYALNNKVEQDLWNHAFKNQITTFQNQVKDKSNPKRGEIQATLGLFLDMASGFYLQLFQELCSAFKLDLSMRKKPQTYGILKDLQTGYSRMTMPKKSASLYICQYCLVHLGDIARYRQQVEQAQTYYRHAASVVPFNGQPYNQLAILEAAKGNKLSTVFYYVRSIAVKHPFPVASTNLEKIYTKITKDNNEYKNKLSVGEVISCFLQFHALLQHCSELDRAKTLLDRLTQGLSSHIPSSFSAYQLLQMTTINLFALHHAKRKLDLGGGGVDGKEGEDNKGEMNGDVLDTDEELSSDEKKSYDMIFEVLLHTLDVILQCAPKHESKLKEHHTLPALKVTLDWLCSDCDTLQHQLFVKFNGIWSNLAKTLNNLQFSQQDMTQPNVKKYDRFPLPEDRDLQCFVPLAKAHKDLEFQKLSLEGVPEMLEPHLRRQRLTQHGLWIAEEFPSLNLLNVHRYKSGRLEFTVTAPQVKLVPGESDGVLETRTVRQNVAIQAIMQNRAKQNRSPANSVDLEKSKSEPVMHINNADIAARKHGSTVGENKNDISNLNQQKVNENRSDTTIPLNPVQSGPALERKQPKMAAVWDSNSDSSVANDKQNPEINPKNVSSKAPPTLHEATPPRTVNQIMNNNQSGVIKASPASSDPWGKPSKPSPSSSEKTKNESETRYFLGEPKTSSEMENIRGPAPPVQQTVQGSNPFGLSAFGPLTFTPDLPIGGNMRQPQPNVRVPMFGAVERPASGRMDMMPSPGMDQQRQRVPNPGLMYPGGVLGPQLPFTTWVAGSRGVHPPQDVQQQLNRMAAQQGEAMRRPSGPWNIPRSVGPWGPNNMSAPQRIQGWGDNFRQGSEDGDDQTMEEYYPHPGAPPNSSPRPIGPSAKQVPLPNFQVPNQQQPPIPTGLSTWGETRPRMQELHPTLRQLFQSAQNPAMNITQPQQQMQQHPQNHPTMVNNAVNLAHNGGQVRDVVPPSSRQQRERYPSSEGRRLSEEGGMSSFGGRNSNEMSKPDSPMAGSPGLGSLFSTTPDNAYPTPATGTYSLFNSQSPWSLPINKDTHSHSSSPFGSSTASNRTSPDHFSADERSPNPTSAINLGFNLPASTAEGTWPVNPQAPVGNSQTSQPPANMLSNNLQSLWSGPSALERLLEAQRQQKTDPH